MRKLLFLLALIAAFVLLNAEYSEFQKFNAGDPDEYDRFGSEVSISGDYALIASPRGAEFGPNSGAVYVFHYENAEWVQTQKLVASNGATQDFFGGEISIDGDYAVIGCQSHCSYGDDDGAAYIFHNNNGIWEEIAFLSEEGLPDDAWMGCSVDIHGDYAIVGIRQDDEVAYHAGSALIYHNTNGIWERVIKLTASDGEASDLFGQYVAISDDYAIIGAHCNDDNGDNSGSVYVFQNNNGAWDEVDLLLASDGQAGDYFGSRIDIYGNTLLIGALTDDDNGIDSGSAYIFENTNGIWAETQKLIAPDGSSGDVFGCKVSLIENKLLIGARGDASLRGSAYCFIKQNETWQYSEKIETSDGSSSDYFGDALALSENCAMIASWGDDDFGELSGSVYVFSEETLTPEIEVNPDDFILEMNSNEIFTDQFTISNIGSGTVFCIIAVSATDPWLTVEPDYCEIAENDSEIIDVIFDTTDLNVGTYQSQIYVIYERYELEIPVTLTVSEVDINENTVPPVIKFIGNYPNPFNPTTTISFQINNQQNEQVELSIYNLKGQRVKTLPVILSGNEVQSSVIWNGTDDNNQPVSSGVYLYKLQAGEFSQTKKMMLMK